MVKRSIVEIDENKCNGCGTCIPKCAEGALQIVDGKARLASDVYCDGLGACLGTCPQDAIRIIEREAHHFNEEDTKKHRESTNVSKKSRLRNWPVQLNLVNPSAAFFKGSDLLIMADCVPIASSDWQTKFLNKQVVLIGCPKFDDNSIYFKKLTEIFQHNTINSVTVVHMEVPCCSGLIALVTRAINTSGKKVPITTIVLSTEGENLF